MKTLNRSTQKVGLNKRLVDNLQGTSFTIIGDDTELNEAVAAVLANRLGWFATSTRKVVAGMLGSKPEELASKDQSEIAKAELSMITGMRTQRRVVLSTMAGGAASARNTYQHMWGSIVLRVDEPDGAKATTPERQLHAELAEMSLKITKGKGFATTGSSPMDKARTHETQLVDSLIAFLNANLGDKEKGILDVVEKKAHYINNGCRGDWPDVEIPPEALEPTQAPSP